MVFFEVFVYLLANVKTFVSHISAATPVCRVSWTVIALMSDIRYCLFRRIDFGFVWIYQFHYKGSFLKKNRNHLGGRWFPIFSSTIRAWIDEWCTSVSHKDIKCFFRTSEDSYEKKAYCLPYSNIIAYTASKDNQRTLKSWGKSVQWHHRQMQGICIFLYFFWKICWQTNRLDVYYVCIREEKCLSCIWWCDVNIYAKWTLHLSHRLLDGHFLMKE